MRHLVLSLVLLSAAVSTGYAQQTSTTPAGGPGRRHRQPHPARQPERTLRPSAVRRRPPARHLRSVSADSRQATPISPLRVGQFDPRQYPVRLCPRQGREGEALPQGVQASPMSDRPGYGRARVNGRMAIVDLNGNHIVELLDSPGSLGGSDRLGGVYGPAQSPAQTPSYTMPFSPPLAGSANSGGAYSGLERRDPTGPPRNPAGGRPAELHRPTAPAATAKRWSTVARC